MNADQPAPMMAMSLDRQALLSDLAALARSGELTVGDFAILHVRYNRLRGQRMPFVPEFVLLMRLLERQARHTADDPDSVQGVDDGQEDDSGNDGSAEGGGSLDWFATTRMTTLRSCERRDGAISK